MMEEMVVCGIERILRRYVDVFHVWSRMENR